MYPILFQIGPFFVSSLWVFIVLAFISASYLLSKYAVRNRLSLTFIQHHWVLFIGLGLLLSRLAFIVSNYSFFLPVNSLAMTFSLIAFWDRGLSLWGALMGFLLALYLACRHDREPIRPWLDVLALALIPSSMLIHIGTFLDGANHGHETSLPWGMTFDSPVVRYAIPIHPTQIYAFIFSLLLTIFIFRLYKKTKDLRPGLVAEMGLAGYAFLRFIEEFFRGDDTLMLGPLRAPYLISMLAFAAAVREIIRHIKKDPTVLEILPQSVKKSLTWFSQKIASRQ